MNIYEEAYKKEKWSKKNNWIYFHKIWMLAGWAETCADDDDNVLTMIMTLQIFISISMSFSGRLKWMVNYWE